MSDAGADGTLPGQRRRRSIFRDDTARAEPASPWVLPEEEPEQPAAIASDGPVRSIFRSDGDDGTTR
ncbi:hypothetical protein [Actinomycetospora aeridis]|uniref:Uncharacterized protein n=1 Tax=Actinomycetospora aeridis TaxID=3129231 RepID=A0ABU8N4B0_9PSEU